MFDLGLALREVADSFYSDDERKVMLQRISRSIEKLNKFEMPDIREKAGPAIHHIFVKFREIRADILKMCSELEKVGCEVTEQCHVDCLIAWYFAQECDLSPTIDVVFRYINRLVTLPKHHIPEAVLRALVVYYYVLEAKPTQGREGDRNEIINIFMEAARYPGNLETVSEVPELLMKHFLKGESKAMRPFLDLLCYAADEGLALVSDYKSLWNLTSPLFAASSNSKNACDAILYMLSTWPGLLFFGIRGNGIHNLIQFKSTGPEPVLSLLKQRLLFNGIEQSVADPMTGFLFAALLREGIIEKLNVFCNNADVGDFLVHVLPYASHKQSAGLDLTEVQNRPLDVPRSMLFKDYGSEQPKLETLRDKVESMLRKKESCWKWERLLVFLSEYVPTMDNINESVKSFPKICEKLLEFFSKQFLLEKNSDSIGIMAETLYALLRVLMGKLRGGCEIIRGCQSFAQALETVLEPVDDDIDEQSPKWALFKSIALLCSNGIGTFAVGQMAGKDGQKINDKLAAFCKHCRNKHNCELILKTFLVQVQHEHIAPIVMAFLRKSPDIHRVVINCLRQKWTSIRNAVDVVFSTVLLTQIKTLDPTGDPRSSRIEVGVVDQEVRVLDLNIFGEILIREPEAITRALNDSGHETIEKQLLKDCRFLFALFMSDKAGLEKSWVQREIDWWMSEGNTKYVTLYDRAIRRVFGEALDIQPEFDAAIFEINKCVTVPPHLFGEMAKTSDGFSKLVPYIPPLLEKLANPKLSDVDARGTFLALGHFASSQFAENYVAENKIAEKIHEFAEKSSSYTIKGTLLAVLSMFRVTPHFMSFLEERELYVFNFGHRRCVIPRDPSAWLGAKGERPLPKFAMFPDVPEFASITADLRQLTNPLAREARARLSELVRNKPPMSSSLALYGHRVMGAYLTSLPDRQCIYRLFCEVPMMEFDAEKEKDTIESAEMSAKLHFSVLNNQVILLSLPRRQLDDIRSMNPPPRCPEAYLYENQFKNVTGVTVTEFYAKSGEEQGEIRRAIMSKQ